MITYRIDIADRHAHLYRVTLSVDEPAAEQRLSLPVWVPGSYLVREFSRHLSSLAATQGAAPVALRQLDKASWLARCRGGETLRVSYLVYAFDTSVRAAFLDADRGFINGTSLCLRVEGRESEAHRLELTGIPPGWQVATALAPLHVDAAGVGSYRAADYDELVDSPLELGRFWRGRFEAGGVPHEFVVAGAWPDFDGERLLADARRICEAQMALWHGDVATPSTSAPPEAPAVAGASPAAARMDAVAVPGGRPPFDRYVFMLNAVEDGHGGLEHRASTALIAPRRNLPQRGSNGATDGYADLLGLVSHEYFHAWNVKRLRPAEFTRYDYARENYTELLWFFEGFTSYYDDLMVLRSGAVDAARYLTLLAKAASSVHAAPGRRVQSVAAASFDAWVKFYRPDENTPNATISYYAKGSLVALALDLSLRSTGQATLDDVLRELWRTSRGGPIGEADIAAALERVGGRSFAAELAAWVHGTDELPLPQLLQGIGVTWRHQPASLAQRLGLRVNESALTGIKVSHVLRGGAAERAGLAAGDELLAVAGWRLRRLDDALRLLQPDAEASLLVARDQRIVSLALSLPDEDAEAGAVALELAQQPDQRALALREAWLGG
jgi:predicted metalloprotease with PDZ domain